MRRQPTRDLRSPSSPTAPTAPPPIPGTRGYGNLLTSVPGLTVYHNQQSVATYGYTGAGGQWWTFDDPWSIGQKTAYPRSKGLLGGMIWEMSGDAPNGTLITALDNGLK
ncbi:glycosyl hydrolase family 18 protein [Saccharothrix sp. ST-888]|uniref:glycosyl hydrolase family 18 protein n=1 Tax=Saccharothrix sp. ST-888 TaxID=1427391 RepID=UPI0005ECB822|nr:hypothetical protein UK12_26775 [Saccharothrix sp. ST-888]